MKSEIRIRIEGNTSDGFTYYPCVWTKWDGDGITPKGEEIGTIRSLFGSKEDIAKYCEEIIEACKKPCIVEQKKIVEIET